MGPLYGLRRRWRRTGRTSRVADGRIRRVRRRAGVSVRFSRGLKRGTGMNGPLVRHSRPGLPTAGVNPGRDGRGAVFGEPAARRPPPRSVSTHRAKSGSHPKPRPDGGVVERDFEPLPSRCRARNEHDVASCQAEGARQQLRDGGVGGAVRRGRRHPQADLALRVEALNAVAGGARRYPYPDA